MRFAGSNPVIPIMEQLRAKIRETQSRINFTLESMLTAEEGEMHTLGLRITFLHQRLNELTSEIERVLQSSLKSDS
jgi:polyhydroxyalkanoate synthesis regulator phasin